MLFTVHRRYAIICWKLIISYERKCDRHVYEGGANQVALKSRIKKMEYDTVVKPRG